MILPLTESICTVVKSAGFGKPGIRTGPGPGMFVVGVAETAEGIEAVTLAGEV